MGKYFWLIFITIALTVSGCSGILPLHDATGGNIRVLVIKNSRSVHVEGAEGTEPLSIILDKDDEVWVNGKEHVLPLTLYPAGEFLRINGKPYRGKVDIRSFGQGINVVNELDLESYLVGLINNEISSKWPIEAVKAQAVVARSYALFHRERASENSYFDLEGSVFGQVYDGAITEDKAALMAVNDTTGEVVAYGYRPALAVYHSNAGGMTDAAVDVWGNRVTPYLASVPSPYDRLAPKFKWSYTVSAAELHEIMRRGGIGIGEPATIIPVELTPAGRVKNMVITDVDGKSVKIRGEDLRRAVGYSTLRSTMFKVVRDDGTFTFVGQGSGHGVGLSQWGAKGMAEDGYDYKEIIKHFYPGAFVKKLY